ncbi:Zn-ribbon domain-containing OB-fold protein [Natronorubrum halophilum]|uniref:Zn-ribbon domain-containing OB-fold protein n=1 Tax=Natronorubrum halophilum TaxID=1702106 RepID=UPI000EF6E32A|nr:OB-fold domain-containing protein [Natronorubrum halophilum]
MTDARDGSYDEFIDALESGDGYYYECSNGHGTLPPRRVCPHCGDRELETVALPATGEVATYTTVAVPTPQFEDDAPYVTAIATFGPVRLTGIIPDTSGENVAIGQDVTAAVEPTETTDERTITFRR